MDVVEEVGLFISAGKQDAHFLQGGDTLAPRNSMGKDAENLSTDELRLGVQAVLETRIEHLQESLLVLAAFVGR